MLIRRAASLTTVTVNHHLRRLSTAALLQEHDTPLHFTYLDGSPKPDPKYNEIIHAIPRAESGTNISTKERRAGRVPSIVFSEEDRENGGNKCLISVLGNQIKKLVNNLGQSFFLSSLFDLEVLSESGSCPRSFIFMQAPIQCLGGDDVSPGPKKGTSLNIIKRTVKYLCPADIIPPFIDVDLSELGVGQKIIAGDLNVHPALKLLRPKDEPVVKILWEL